jgi:transcriptional regulator CtsR
MPNLSDDIEEYIKEQLEVAGRILETSRRDLAELFGCVPSQINYVLQTRFSPARGYSIETRRGGGGYIRITRLDAESASRLINRIRRAIGDHIAQDDAVNYIHWLLEEGFISEREAALMRAAVDRETIAIELPVRDYLRANILKAMSLALLPYLTNSGDQRPYGGER